MAKDRKKPPAVEQKARTQLGWKPAVDFKSLVRMMVDADMARP